MLSSKILKPGNKNLNDLTAIKALPAPSNTRRFAWMVPKTRPMDAMALGWVVVLSDGNAPLMLNKTGGLQGQFSYVVIAPTRGVGVFASLNAFSVGGFTGMVQAVISGSR